MGKRLNYLLFFSLLVSCNNTNTKQEEIATTSIVLQEMIVENGGDVKLHIIDSIKNSDSGVIQYKVASMYKNLPVGFLLKIKKTTDQPKLIAGTLTFLPLKDTSDNFLKALSDIYQVKQNKFSFADTVTATYINLSAMVDTNEPGNWVAAEMKIFFSINDNNPELFLNIDKNSGTISLVEKDSEYRKEIIEALSKH